MENVVGNSFLGEYLGAGFVLERGNFFHFNFMNILKRATRDEHIVVFVYRLVKINDI